MSLFLSLAILLFSLSTLFRHSLLLLCFPLQEGGVSFVFNFGSTGNTLGFDKSESGYKP